MENHPIPQDVTGFKFKLIGSVTVKQFLYILGGGILAAICFMVPGSAFIKLPFCALFGGIGVMLAFVPVEGRPMDVMIKNFLRALPAENQYIYRKRGADALIGEFFSPQTVATAKAIVKEEAKSTDLDSKRALLYSALKKGYRPDNTEQQRLSQINSFLADPAQKNSSLPIQNVDALPKESSATQIATPSSIPQVNVSDAIKVVTPTFVAPPKETAIAKPAPQITAAEPQQAAQPEIKVQETQSPHVVQDVQAPIPEQASPLTTIPATPQQMQTVAPNETSSVTSVAPQASLKAGFPQLPDTPNVVMGIIKDPRGKIIPNILVEIMDMQGIPVRAFKTNALGQFAAATPLPNGEYNVLLEDPRKQNEFEQIHIVLEGKIFEPLEIVSVDQRERLRRELFGGNQAMTPPQVS